MRDKLVQALMGMAQAPPETEEGFRAAQKLIARYAKNKSKKQPARTKRGMARVLTDPDILAHLEAVREYSPMCAAAAELDAGLGYGTTATFPTLPSAVWNASKFLILGAGSYQPAVLLQRNCSNCRFLSTWGRHLDLEIKCSLLLTVLY